MEFCHVFELSGNPVVTVITSLACFISILHEKSGCTVHVSLELHLSCVTVLPLCVVGRGVGKMLLSVDLARITGSNRKPEYTAQASVNSLAAGYAQVFGYEEYVP